MQSSDNPAPVRPDERLPGGIRLFFVSLGVLAAIRVALGYIPVPLGMLPVANFTLAILFLAVPILALFFGANAWWNPKIAGAMVAGGLGTQIGLVLLVSSLSMPPQIGGLLEAVAQMALAVWCVGLGALLATLIKEKNIILPIAIFLAAYDFFLVLTPWGFTQKLLKAAQPAFSKIAAQIPTASTAPAAGLVKPQAFVGMADLVFLAMFFIALFRFRMRTRETLFAVVPALLAYLFVVLLFGNYSVAGMPLGQLPAMVPIGLAVLVVNWREFQLSKDEKASTIVLAVLALGFLVFAATRPKPPTAPVPSASVRAPRSQADLPERVSPNQRR